MKTKIIEGKLTYYSNNERRLMSPSGLISFFNPEKYENVYAPVLDKARNFGIDFMIALEQQLRGESTNTTPEQELCLKSLINYLKSNNLQPIDIEKHIYDDYFHGFVDIECENKVIEIKTRGDKANIDLNMVLQCSIYSKITNKEVILLFLNRTTGELKVIEIDEDLKNEAEKIIERYIEIKDTLFKRKKEKLIKKE